MLISKPTWHTAQPTWHTAQSTWHTAKTTRHRRTRQAHNKTHPPCVHINQRRNHCSIDLLCRSTATHGAMCADRTMRSQRQKFTVRILYCPTSCTLDSSSLVTAPSRKPRLTSAESPQPARQRKDVRWRLFWCQAKGCQANASHLGSGSRAWAQEDRAPAASILAESRQAARTARVAARHGSSVPPGCSDSARCRMAWELY